LLKPFFPQDRLRKHPPKLLYPAHIPGGDGDGSDKHGDSGNDDVSGEFPEGGGGGVVGWWIA